VRLCELLAFFVAHAADADVIDRLAGFEQLNHLVDAFGFVAGVSALGGQERCEGDSQHGGERDSLHGILAFSATRKGA
jgi:hypothetical protein